MKVWKSGSVAVKFFCAKVFDKQTNKNLELSYTSMEEWKYGNGKVYFL
jgi:hypothetical protein